MIARLFWFAGVFGLSVWLGAHWDARPAVSTAGPAAVLPFDPGAVITRPFQELTSVFNRRE